MCGIAGIYQLNDTGPVDPHRIKVMCDSIAHRGPDGEGIWTGPGIGLGHRRLSIIDISGGAQPMTSTDGRLSLVFNGEIYNFAAVRGLLEALGHRFNTSSDTEVILHGWRQWGADCVSQFDGMFSFAIYDRRDQSLFLCRDRFGVKPLYYAVLEEGALIFGSELKALLAHPGLHRTLNPHAVDAYLAFGYVPDHLCILAGVEKLPAGHALMVQRGRPLPKPSPYWDISFDRRASGSEEVYREGLLDHLRVAVKSRMVADVPLGAFLSGGVDSSAIVALMAEHSGQKVKTCSIGFNVAGLDETGFAAEVASRFQTDHRSLTVNPHDFGLIDVLADHFDEPFGDASALPTYRVCQLARQRVKVALSGDGVDEALAGYRRYRLHANEDRVRAMLPRMIRRPLFGALGRIYPKADWAPQYLRAKTTFQGLTQDSAESYAMAVGVTSHAQRHRLYTPEFARSLQGHRAEACYIDLIRNAPATDPLSAVQYADLKLWLPGDILTKLDRMSMAVGLEAREPLLDHRLVQYAAEIPAEMRLRGGEGKYIFKQAMSGHLPDHILYRRKMGFVTPIGSWFRGPLADEARRFVGNAAIAHAGMFMPDMLHKFTEDHIAGRADHGRLLWLLMMLDRSLAKIFSL
ncbi:XrtA/PEP-CTERM system amidotransferase [Aquisediminimonas sediminicola]|uniref:XrtA/PEP-CTERM system amidotransferase n=1 Tax=Alteraquisediminimonas sediminicola TaxID=2676787 RepID=UPI001C8DA3CD|nr:XrtA/PEP-CTERM system amidotransferase [Aquisediminimonas sediminicola]